MFKTFNNKTKKILLAVIIASLIFSGIPSSSVGATELIDESKTGYMQPQGVRIDYEGDELETAAEYSINLYEASAEENYWRRYASTYYRSKLSGNERAFYDRLDSYCMNILLGGHDIDTSSILNSVSAEGVTYAQQRNVYLLFMNANPQYFFLDAGYSYGYYGSYNYFKPYVYSNYVSGSARVAARNTIKNKLDSWVGQISAISTSDPYSRVKKAYQIVAANVSYDNRAYYDDTILRSHQSAATAILNGLSVCAGYSELLEMLIQASGIDCIVVTSTGHEWNQVRIGNYWYNVDITWDDMGSRAGEYYFCLGDTSFRSKGTSGGHVPESYYSTVRPICRYDYGTEPAPNPETEPEQKDTPFTDVSSNAFYHDAVVWAVKNNITTGTNSTTFSPTADCKRQDVVTFLWRAAGSPEPNAAYMNKFSDVKSGSYYEKAVAWAVEKGITTGTSTTTFNPTGLCKREEIVTFLWRANSKPAVSGTSGFSDVAPGKYYTTAVTWAVNNGITTGTSTTTFSPTNNCNRGQVVTFLYRNYN